MLMVSKRAKCSESSLPSGAARQISHAPECINHRDFVRIHVRTAQHQKWRWLFFCSTSSVCRGAAMLREGERCGRCRNRDCRVGTLRIICLLMQPLLKGLFL